MHKFTYLLSDSYRQQHNGKLNASSYLQQSQLRSSHHNSLSNQPRSSQRPLSIPSKDQNFNTILNKYRQNINQYIKTKSSIQYKDQIHPNKEYLQRRINKLQNLTQKHRIIISNKELQNRLKTISVHQVPEYSKLNRQRPKEVKQVTRKYNYKVKQISQPLQQKVKLPQRSKLNPSLNLGSQKYNSKPLQQSNRFYQRQTQDHQLKINVRDYLIQQNCHIQNNQQSIQKYQLKPSQGKDLTKESKVDYQTVAKLSSLQSRIKSSIKPYLDL